MFIRFAKGASISEEDKVEDVGDIGDNGAENETCEAVVGDRRAELGMSNDGHGAFALEDERNKGVRLDWAAKNSSKTSRAVVLGRSTRVSHHKRLSEGLEVKNTSEC